MKGWLSRLLAVTSLAACIAAFAAPAHAEKRVALVVGNNDYRNVPKLQKAVNDARTMGDTLKQLGFTVMVAENQNRQAFSQTLLAFDRAVDAGDTDVVEHLVQVLALVLMQPGGSGGDRR